jgi:hypothetical protein
MATKPGRPESITVGLCSTCRHSRFNETSRGTEYVRCERAKWDARLVKYPRLPVLRCVGYEPGERDPEVPPER